MPTALKNLRLREVSLVDRGANQHAHVSLFKGRERDTGEDMFKTKEEFDAAVESAVRKQVSEAVQKASGEVVAGLKRENALLKMSPAHREYMSVMKMDAAAQDAFIAKSEHDRETQVRAEPVEKALPAHVQEQLRKSAENEVLLKGLIEKDQVATFEKRATDVGLPAKFGEVMRKAYSGDQASIVKMEQAIKGLAAQADMGKVFSEFGTTSGSDATLTANEELQKKADDYREEQAKVGKRLTPQQAFSKIYDLPENAGLRERAKAEDMKKRG